MKFKKPETLKDWAVYAIAAISLIFLIEAIYSAMTGYGAIKFDSPSEPK